MAERLGMQHVLAALVLFVPGCHLVFPHAPGVEARRDASLDLPSLDLRPDRRTAVPPIDLLFVIDNSSSMLEEQKRLAVAFPALLQAMTTGGALPDLRIGVVSTDLGAGPYSFTTCEVVGGDGGKLLATPKGCALPSQPWIAHADGKTNLPTNAPVATQIAEAFACIATLGDGGCGFEQPLAAAWRALDPAVNPGFLREAARLGILFLGDEDDCSAADTGLYDPANNSLGPLSSFRCTRFGYTCKEPLTTVGPKTSCAPDGTKLKTVASFVALFAGLKPPGELVVAAIAGPSSPMEVTLVGSNLELKPSCSSGVGNAAPALRLEAFTKGLAANGQTGLFNQGIDAKGTLVPVTICSDDHGPALHLFGRSLVTSL